MKASPAALTMRRLRKEGFNVYFCQTWNSFTRRSHDLFGIFDVVGLAPGITVGVQATSSGNLAARVKKIKASEWLPKVKEACWKIQVEGWKLKNHKYVSRIIDL